MINPTWRTIATYAPEFVQWIVQTHGPLPEGPVLKEDYEKYYDAYMEREGHGVDGGGRDAPNM